MRWYCLHPGDPLYDEHERLTAGIERATTAEEFEAAFNAAQAFSRSLKELACEPPQSSPIPPKRATTR